MATAYSRREYAGGATNTTIPTGMGVGDGSFTLASATNWSDTNGHWFVVVDPGLPTAEKIECSSIAGLVVTVAASGRGADGSSAQEHAAGCQVECIGAAQDFDEANQLVSQILGSAVGTTEGYVLAIDTNGATPTLDWVAATSPSLADTETFFTAAGQIIFGTGSGTGELLNLLSAIETQFTAAGQVILGTGSGTGELLDILSAIETKFTAAGQVFFGTGSGTGELLDLLSALETKFTAEGQLIVGSGSGTGGLLNLGSDTYVLTSNGTTAVWAAASGGGSVSAANIEATFTAEGQIYLGTGSGTGELLALGTSGKVLTAGASQASWAAPYSTVLATTNEHELTDTSLDSIVTYTPGAAGNFGIGIYFRVVTATTTVTVEVTYTDVTGAETLTVVNAVAEVVGVYSIVNFTIASAASDAITVKAQAGTANQVYVSASIIQE